MTEYICKEVQTDNGGYLEPVTELIRCKDCKYWDGDDDDTFCSELGIFGTGPNSYCSYAKRKEV